MPVSIPRAHAEALIAVSAGRIDSLQTSLSLDQHPLRLSRIVAPGLLDLITITFDGAAASAFEPPAWFGPEAGDDLDYRTSALARDGIPVAPEIEVSNAGLESLLDVLENRASGRSAVALSTQPAAGPLTAKSPAGCWARGSLARAAVISC